MAFHIIDELKKKPRSEWRRYLRDGWANARIWIQENGEAAFVTGVVLGFFVVVFYKLVIAFIALSVLGGGVVYSNAPEEEDFSGKSGGANGRQAHQGGGSSNSGNSEQQGSQGSSESSSQSDSSDDVGHNVQSTNVEGIYAETEVSDNSSSYRSERDGVQLH